MPPAHANVLQHGILGAISTGVGQPLSQARTTGIKHAGDVVAHVCVQGAMCLHGFCALQRQGFKRLVQQVCAKALGELSVGHGQCLWHGPALGGGVGLHGDSWLKVAMSELCAQKRQNRISSSAICFAALFTTTQEAFR
jgi:hypothetical protein